MVWNGYGNVLHSWFPTFPNLPGFWSLLPAIIIMLHWSGMDNVHHVLLQILCKLQHGIMALAVVSEIWQNSETKILQLEFAKRLYLKEIIATTKVAVVRESHKLFFESEGKIW
jgi:hypothetical protein